MSVRATTDRNSRFFLPFVFLSLCLLALIVSLVGLYFASAVANERAVELQNSWQGIMQDGVQGSELLATDVLLRGTLIPVPSIKSAAFWSLSMGLLNVILFAWFAWAVRADSIARLASIRKSSDNDIAAVSSLLDEMAPLASGDLDVVATPRSGLPGALADTFNHTVTELQSLVASQLAASRGLSLAVVSFKTNIMSMEELCNSQSEYIVESSNSLSAMSDSSGALSASASELSTSSKRISSSVASWGREVDNASQLLDAVRVESSDTAALINSVNGHSVSIAECTSRIEEFLEHTQHLAINATLQASSQVSQKNNNSDISVASFGSLSDAVAALAEEIGRAVNDIGTLACAVNTDTKDALSRMHRIDSHVVEQSNQLRAQASLIEALLKDSQHINSNARQFAQHGASYVEVVANVSRNLDGINETSRSSTQRVQEASRTLHALNTLATQMRQEHSEFKLPDAYSSASPEPTMSDARKAAERAVLNG